VQGRQNQGNRGDLFDRVLVDGYSAAVIGDPDTAVGLQCDVNTRRVPGQRFIDGVIDDLVNQVV